MHAQAHFPETAGGVVQKHCNVYTCMYVYPRHIDDVLGPWSDCLVYVCMYLHDGVPSGADFGFYKKAFVIQTTVLEAGLKGGAADAVSHTHIHRWSFRGIRGWLAMKHYATPHVYHLLLLHRCRIETCGTAQIAHKHNDAGKSVCFRVVRSTKP